MAKSAPPKPIQQEIQDSVNKRAVSTRSGEPPTFTFQSLIDALAEVFKDRKIDASDLELATTYAEGLYDSHLRHRNLPGVPELVEPFVDDVVKSLIRPALKQLFDRFAPANQT